MSSASALIWRRDGGGVAVEGGEVFLVAGPAVRGPQNEPGVVAAGLVLVGVEVDVEVHRAACRRRRAW